MLSRSECLSVETLDFLMVDCSVETLASETEYMSALPKVACWVEMMVDEMVVRLENDEILMETQWAGKMVVLMVVMTVE
jgi:hypothetical protein